MSLLDRLYGLYPFERASTLLEPYFRNVAASIASPNVNTAQIIVPDDRVLLLQHVHMEARAGAAQTVTRAFLNLHAESGTLVGVLLGVESQVAAGSAFGHFTGEIVIPPLWQFQGSGNFSAGVAANLVDLLLCGVLIPLGNIARV